MPQIINEVKQAELIKDKVSTTGGMYSVTLSAKHDNSAMVRVGNGSNQDTELEGGDAMDVPGDALGDVYVRGTPPGWTITDVIQGSKEFKFLGDQTERILVGDNISVVGSTGNDGFYSVAAVSFGGGKTTVQVNETIPDATADGTLYHADKIILFARG